MTYYVKEELVLLEPVKQIRVVCAKFKVTSFVYFGHYLQSFNALGNCTENFLQQLANLVTDNTNMELNLTFVTLPGHFSANRVQTNSETFCKVFQETICLTEGIPNNKAKNPGYSGLHLKPSWFCYWRTC